MDCPYLLGGWVCSWGEYLAEADDPALGRWLRLHENTGRPLGQEGFVRRLERRLGRKLLPGKPGRPRTSPKARK